MTKTKICNYVSKSVHVKWYLILLYTITLNKYLKNNIWQRNKKIFIAPYIDR